MNMINLLFAICLLITGAVCDDVNCTEETKISFSILFCDEATHCSNDTAEKLLDDFRHCISKNSDETKKLIESGNKLEPEECVKEVSNGVCAFVKEMSEHGLQFAECFAPIMDMESVMSSCVQTDDDQQAKVLEDIAMVTCADVSTMKCDNTDALEALKIVKNCLNEKVPGIKEVKNNGNTKECKAIAKETWILAAQNNKLSDFLECLKPKKEFIDKYDVKDCPELQ